MNSIFLPSRSTGIPEVDQLTRARGSLGVAGQQSLEGCDRIGSGVDAGERLQEDVEARHKGQRDTGAFVVSLGQRFAQVFSPVSSRERPRKDACISTSPVLDDFAARIEDVRRHFAKHQLIRIEQRSTDTVHELVECMHLSVGRVQPCVKFVFLPSATLTVSASDLPFGQNCAKSGAPLTIGRPVIVPIPLAAGGSSVVLRPGPLPRA